MLRLYVETSVWSSLTDRTDPERRRETRRFLEWCRPRHRLLSSRVVLRELKGIRDSSLRRNALRLYESFRKRIVPENPQAERMARDLIRLGCVTENHLADAVHLAYTIFAGADALVTWNMGDLARPHTRMIVRGFCRRNGLPDIRIDSPVEVARWLGVRIR